MSPKPKLILATGLYIGEGFDDAWLDTPFLTMRVSWKGNLVQYAGRLHRLHPGKTEVRIYDYVDRKGNCGRKRLRKGVFRGNLAGSASPLNLHGGGNTMGPLKVVMTVQAVVLLAYALPMLLVPRLWTVLTQQNALPENYILRAVGIAFLILGYLELKIAGDLARYQALVFAFAALPALFCVTIILQALKRGFAGQPAFYGAAWYWWVNAVVTAVFAIAVVVANRRG